MCLRRGYVCVEISYFVLTSGEVAAGISTSIFLETSLLRFGGDKLSGKNALRTATGMSMMSMLAMEVAENSVDYALTGSVVDLSSTQFWLAASLALVVGYVTPLPYNYLRLRRYGLSCH